jgi:hypothetical protein
MYCRLTVKSIMLQEGQSGHDSKRPHKDKRRVNLISDVLPFGRLLYGGANAISNAIGYAKFFSRSHDAVIRVYDDDGNVIETHQPTGDFKAWWREAQRKAATRLT